MQQARYQDQIEGLPLLGHSSVKALTVKRSLLAVFAPGIRYLDRTDVEAVAVNFREVFNDVAKTTTNIAYPHPRLRPCVFVDAIFSRSFGTQDCLGEQI